MFRRILVPTDFSAPSDAALEYARGLAAIFGASLHLLHVADDSLVAGSFSPIPEVYVGPDSLTSCKDVLTDAHERLAHRVTSNDRARFRATTEVMFGRAAETIADYAADNGFDLIVMGTHGRSGLAASVHGERRGACRAHRAMSGADDTRGAGTGTCGRCRLSGCSSEPVTMQSLPRRTVRYRVATVLTGRTSPSGTAPDRD